MAVSLPKRLIFSALAITLVFGAVELGAAAWEFLPYGARSGPVGPVGLYRKQTPEAAQRPQLQPGASLHGLLYRVDINSLGFRGPELAVPKPDDGLRIWCTGGSTTFDIFAPDNASTWPARLGLALQAALTERTVEVINAGIPGEIFSGSQEDLETFYERVRPDVLVVYAGPNDLRRARDVLDPPPRSVGARPPSLATIRLVRLLQSRLADPVAQPEIELDDLHMADVERELTRLLDSADALGLRVLLASHALRLGLPPAPGEAERQLRSTSLLFRMQPEAAARAFDRYNALVRDVAERRGYGFVDVRAAVPADGRYWGDDTHFSASGSALAGEAVARAILELGMDRPDQRER